MNLIPRENFVRIPAPSTEAVGFLVAKIARTCEGANSIQLNNWELMETERSGLVESPNIVKTV